MGISINEFVISMETFGATRISNYKVPAFNVKGVNFVHSGSYYIVQRYNKIPEKIMNKAMSILGEKHPGGDNFWYGEIHSLKGLLTLVSMLEDRYSKEGLKELINATYKKIFECPLIKVNMPFQKLPSPRMEQLRKFLSEYDYVVNPFNGMLLKEPAEYLESIKIKISLNCTNARLELSNQTFSTKFYNSLERLSYQTNGWNNAKRKEKSGYTAMEHYYVNGSDFNQNDEVVYLYCNTYDYLRNFDLQISLKTGLAWKTHQEKVPATNEQIAFMITNLKISIMKAKKNIISNMI